MSSYAKSAIGVAVGLSVYGFAQIYLPRLTFDPDDIAASFLGATVAIMLASILFFMKKTGETNAERGPASKGGPAAPVDGSNAPGGPPVGGPARQSTQRRSYLVAHGKQDSQTFNVPFVTFTPACKEGEDKGFWGDAGPFIGVYDGFFPYDPGGEARPSQVLKREILMNTLAQLDLVWFVPYVERMARGEHVDLEEVDAAYRARNGHGMESSLAPPLRFSFMGNKKDTP